MSSQKKNEPTLNAIDVLSQGYEVCVNETYEMMSWRNFISATLLFILCVILVAVSIAISPQPKTTIIKRPEGTESRTKELTLAIRYRNLKFYHRSITYGIQSNLHKKNMLVVVSGTIKFKKNTRVVKELTLEERVIRLFPKTVVPLFSTGRREITDIMADLDLTLTDGSFDDIYTVWTHENASWIFFTILLRSVSFLVALYLFFHLFTRIVQMKKKSPTYTQRFLMVSCLVLAVLWLPLPELRNFDLLHSLSPIISLFENINYATVFYVMNVVCWNLVYRFTDSEIPFIKRATFALFMMCGCLALPRAFKYKDPFYQDILEIWIPTATMLLFVLNLMRFPIYLNSSSPEFTASFIHLFCTIPAMAIMIYCTATNADRNSKLSVFSTAMNTISLLFLVLLHWPRDEAGDDAQYIAADTSHEIGGLMDDDEMDNKDTFDIEIPVEKDDKKSKKKETESSSYYSDEEEEEDEED